MPRSHGVQRVERKTRKAGFPETSVRRRIPPGDRGLRPYRKKSGIFRRPSEFPATEKEELQNVR
jgi:hypothetical protein